MDAATRRLFRPTACLGCRRFRFGEPSDIVAQLSKLMAEESRRHSTLIPRTPHKPPDLQAKMQECCVPNVSHFLCWPSGPGFSLFLIVARRSAVVVFPSVTTAERRATMAASAAGSAQPHPTRKRRPPSFPRRRESSVNGQWNVFRLRNWIPACAGMTSYEVGAERSNRVRVPRVSSSQAPGS